MDCFDLNGTIDSSYSTISASSSTSVQLPSSSTTGLQSPTSSAASSTTSFQSPTFTPTSSTTGFQSPPSSPTSSLPSNSSSINVMESSRGGKNNHVNIIVPTVVAAPILSFLIFLVWWKRFRKSRKGDVKDNGDRKKPIELGSLLEHSHGQKPGHSPRVTIGPPSDAESAHSEFSVPGYPQASLKDRTPERSSP